MNNPPMAAIIRECCQRFNAPGGISYPRIIRKLQAKNLRGSHLNFASWFTMPVHFGRSSKFLTSAMFRKRPRASRTLGFQPFDVLDPVAEGTWTQPLGVFLIFKTPWRNSCDAWLAEAEAVEMSDCTRFKIMISDI